MGVTQDQSKGFAYLEQACDLGSSDGCATLATAYLTGQGLAQDANKAYRMAQKGCDMNHAPSCMLLGTIQLTGDQIEPDITAALANLDKACALQKEVCHTVEQIREMAKQTDVIE